MGWVSRTDGFLGAASLAGRGWAGGLCSLPARRLCCRLSWELLGPYHDRLSPPAGHQGSFCMLCVMQNHIIQAFANSGNAIKPVSFIRDLRSKSGFLPGRAALPGGAGGCWGGGMGASLEASCTERCRLKLALEPDGHGAVHGAGDDPCPGPFPQDPAGSARPGAVCFGRGGR